MHEILTKENLKTALLRGVSIEVTCEHGPDCCSRGNLSHDKTTDKYSYCGGGGTLFRTTTQLEHNWCVMTPTGSYRFFTEKPVHSTILKRKQL